MAVQNNPLIRATDRRSFVFAWFQSQESYTDSNQVSPPKGQYFLDKTWTLQAGCTVSSLKKNEGDGGVIPERTNGQTREDGRQGEGHVVQKKRGDGLTD